MGWVPGRERNIVLRLKQLPCPEVKSYLVYKVRFICEPLRVHTDCWHEERFYLVQSGLLHLEDRFSVHLLGLGIEKRR